MTKITLLLVYMCFVTGSFALDKKPNVILFLTDDQDSVLDGLSPMKNVQRFIGSNGLKFINSYTTSPICCPSRSSLLTGLYIHNHRTSNNSIAGGCYSSEWKNQHEPNTFAALLNKAGYSTFYAGKYLNQYGTKESGDGKTVVPPGWSEWHGLVGNSVYYNYTLINNGVPSYSSDIYLTDAIRDLALNYIKSLRDGAQPFLMVLAPPAPHQPFTPAERHRGTYSNSTVPRHPNFNIASNDKHWLIRMPPAPLPPAMLTELDKVFQKRWESLLAVDDMVGDVVNALELNDLLRDTYLIYTSDNGYHIGQFSQVYDKRQPYETDIKVPLLISGPNIPTGTSNTPVLNIDLAPTILKLAGLYPPVSMDGKPIDFTSEAKEDRYMLVEYYGEGSESTVDGRCQWKYDGRNLAQCAPEYDCKCQDSRNNTFLCIRHFATNINYKYCMFQENQIFEEIYDLSADPYEVTNIAGRVFPAMRHWYQWLIGRMMNCHGVHSCSNPM